MKEKRFSLCNIYGLISTCFKNSMGKKLLPKLNRGKRFIIPFKETAIKLFSRNDIVW